MFETSEQLMEFVDNADEVLMDQVFEGAIADTCLYENEYITAAMDRYVQMLETDEVDEKFEEHLSTIIAPYFASSAAFYEDLMVVEEVKIPGGKIAKKIGIATKSAAGKALQGAKNLKFDTQFKARGLKKSIPHRLKGKMVTAKEAIGKAASKAGERLSNAKFDAQFKARGMMKRMRHKYGAKALARKIKRGYQSAAKWAKGTKLGGKIDKAMTAGMLKRSEKLGAKQKKLDDKVATKLAKA